MINKILWALLIGASTSVTILAQNIDDNSSDKMTLQKKLDQKKADFNAKAPAEKKRIYQEGIDAVVATGILEKAIQVGDTAPDFTLKNALGEKVSLYNQLKKGAVILTWYRGGWCPYCNITLHELQQELPNFKAAGAHLLALTPEVPDQSISTAEKHELEFEVLSDVGNVVGKNYGIVYTLTPEVAEIYQAAFGLHQYNGDTSNELPLAATYVIDENGVVQYAFLDAEYRNRAEPSEILEAVKKIK
jgi:peroxiredoxin